MGNYLEFKDARCKDCYKCLRECPVKAIEVINHQAQIIEERCILCGACTRVCPQNAKSVRSERERAEELLNNGRRIVASVAPSFISSFGLKSFAPLKKALLKIGFFEAEETAVGARIVTDEYERLLKQKTYRNFITSCCPAINRMIQLYYPDALKYLAPVDSPMTAHAKVLKKRYPDAEIIFIGPCIAKKREAADGGLVSCALTFEDLDAMLKGGGFDLSSLEAERCGDGEGCDSDCCYCEEINRAKYYPISRGIIKSFKEYPAGYEYVAVDGVKKCAEVLANIEELDGIFLEMNACEYSCVNGPCAVPSKGGAVKANGDVRKYTVRGLENEGKGACELININKGLDFTSLRTAITNHEHIPSEHELQEILAKTGKFKKEDELNCGACGYKTCREKAWAVANGYANIEMCLPYMRERAESMSYEIIKNSPNGIIMLDTDSKIVEMNRKAADLLGVDYGDYKGRDAFDCFDSAEFVVAFSKGENVYNTKAYINKTKAHVELSVIVLSGGKGTFGVMKDITEKTAYAEKLRSVKEETLLTADDVVKKQMRVAQEIASLLGETTAETKVALLKLKKTIADDGNGEV